MKDIFFKNKVIVLGGDHHNTLGVVRSLGRKGVLPYVIITSDGQSSFVLKSKYIKKGWLVKTTEELMDVLKQDFMREPNKPVLIACSDIISSYLDQHYESLSSYFILPGCAHQGKVTKMMNKKIMGEIAVECGMNIPQTLILNDNIEIILNDITYPCITKPIESRNGSKSEILVCHNKEQLKQFYFKVNERELLVQEFIEKEFEFQLIGCSTKFGDDIIIPGVSIILRQPSTTNTGFLHYKELDQTYQKTLSSVKNYIKQIGYSGLFSAEFIRDVNGTDYFLEINFRNDGNSISVTNAGVNLPYIWYLSCLNNDYEDEIKTIHEEFVMPEFVELGLYTRGFLSFSQLRMDMKKATSYMDFASDDPAPTNGWCQYRFKRFISPMIRYFYTNRVLNRPFKKLLR